jgi:protein-S-isoprenylcysteine O-methyltransferase Ste14
MAYAGPFLTLIAVAAYGALHSLLAAERVKRAARTFSARLGRSYRLLFNLVAGVTYLPVLVVVAAYPGPLLYRIPWPFSLVAVALQLLALAVLALGLLQTDPWHFLGFRQLLSADSGGNGLLVKGGLYRWVRHPLYTAGLAFIWPIPIMTASLLAMNIALTIYILIGSTLEERRLLGEFGVAYAEYQRQVPKLIPLPGCVAKNNQPPQS